jgi:hypothetical protein
MICPSLKLVERMALANGIGLQQAGYPENEPGGVPHLSPIRRPVVPDTANIPEWVTGRLAILQQARGAIASES